MRKGKRQKVHTSKVQIAGKGESRTTDHGSRITQKHVGQTNPPRRKSKSTLMNGRVLPLMAYEWAVEARSSGRRFG